MAAPRPALPRLPSGRVRHLCCGKMGAVARLVGPSTYYPRNREVNTVESDTTRRDFLLGGTAAAGLLAAGAAPAAEPPGQHQHEHGKQDQDYPRDHPGTGGPVGSPTDRGKLVP